MRAIILAFAPSFALAFGMSRDTKCGEKGVSSQIVNGADAPECAWKWQVGLLQKASSSYPFCGGMLVGEQWVLTAAHCIEDPNDLSAFYVIAGTTNLDVKTGKEQIVRPAAITKHHKYKVRTTDYDIALIKLAEPFNMTSCVGTICLPGDDDVTAESECWVTGWGTLSEGGPRSKVLQEAKVGIISNADCVSKFDYSPGRITDRMICAQGALANGSIVDTCQGDSGGPLACKSKSGSAWTIYGATSWGAGCARAKYPGVWARVHELMDFVTAVMDETYTPPPCPSFASGPDEDGDCQCNDYHKCSTQPDGGLWDCPTSGLPGAFGGRWFQAGCKECKCF